MRRFWSQLVVLGFLSAVPAGAQTAADFNEGCRLVKDGGTGIFTLSWWGQSGRTYFIQTSLDLRNWSYMPWVETGPAAVQGIQFTYTTPAQFWRLRYTDQSTGGRGAAEADFDGDGIGNEDELAQGTDPLSWTDSDADGLPDDWEQFWWGHLNMTGSEVNSATGLSHLTSFRERRNPTVGEAGAALGLIVYSSLE